MSNETLAILAQAFLYLCTFLIALGIVGWLMDLKIDWTVDKKLLLWYWEYDDIGRKKREYIVLFKLK